MKQKYTEKCPVCGKDMFNVTEGYQRHIVMQARHEVWVKAFDGETSTPHFEYYLKHTKPAKRSVRTWKNVSVCTA
jgi:hypothetical protein